MGDSIQSDRLAYSPAEAARMLGISRAFLYNLMSAGTVPFVKLGSRRLIRRDVLLRVLDDAGSPGDGNADESGGAAS